jgi:hypothetical protein
MGNYSSTPETHSDETNIGKNEDVRSVDVDIDANLSVVDEDSLPSMNEDTDVFDQDDLVINLVSKGRGRNKKVTKRSVSKSSKKAAKTKSTPSSTIKSQPWTLAKAVLNNMSDASMDLAEENGFGFSEGTRQLEPMEEGTTYMSRDEIKKDSRVVLALAESLYDNRSLLKKRPRGDHEPEESGETEPSPPVRASKRARKTPPPEASPLPVTRSRKTASKASDKRSPKKP